MSDPVANPADVLQSQQAQQVDQTANPAKLPGGDVNSATMVSSLAELKEKAPDVYKQTLKGIASTILGQMQRSQDRLKKIIREGNQ